MTATTQSVFPCADHNISLASLIPFQKRANNFSFIRNFRFQLSNEKKSEIESFFFTSIFEHFNLRQARVLQHNGNCYTHIINNLVLTAFFSFSSPDFTCFDFSFYKRKKPFFLFRRNSNQFSELVSYKHSQP
jgi:hypothetical protein